MEITRHAEIRAHERFGWDCAELRRKAELSLTDGIYIFFDEVLENIFESCKKNGGLPYYYEGAVFVFDGIKLVTVYPLMGRYL
jgi:tartrate dehydratase beta subunit/fumarate hydratase class I family protein